ncbi:hypothetical protein KBD20_00050 [Candidatus Saccharibacteria bacterium]|nr:hypothetical protein [Candidatus Saccharibacteria bacterium]
MSDNPKPKLTVIQGGKSDLMDPTSEASTNEPFPFPDQVLLEDIEVINPDVVKQYIAAAESHADLGDTETVVEKLRLFPDPDFAAKMALRLGEDTESRSLLELARELDTSERMAQRAGAALLSILIKGQEASQPAEPVAEEVEDSSEPQTEVDEKKDVLGKVGKERVEEMNAELRLLKETIKSEKTQNGRNNAQVAFDRHVLRLLTEAGSAGDIDLAGRLRALPVTQNGRNTAQIAFDRHVLRLLTEAGIAGDIDRAEQLATLTVTQNGRNNAQVTFDRHLLNEIKKAIHTNRPDEAKSLSGKLKTQNGRNNANVLLRSA